MLWQYCAGVLSSQFSLILMVELFESEVESKRHVQHEYTSTWGNEWANGYYLYKYMKELTTMLATTASECYSEFLRSNGRDCRIYTIVLCLHATAIRSAVPKFSVKVVLMVKLFDSKRHVHEYILGYNLDEWEQLTISSDARSESSLISTVKASGTNIIHHDFR